MRISSKILVIDDEVQIRRFLKASLPEEQFQLLEAGTAAEGMQLLTAENPEVLLLDLGLPDKDGLVVTKEVREWSQIPIIILSARGQEADKVAALDAGADDYLTKPFGISELLARIRVALRHSAIQKAAFPEAVFVNGDLRIDFAAHQVFVRGEEVHLTPNEYKFLALLAHHAGMVVTQKHILNEVWGPGYETESHYLRLYMTQLRHKIEAEPAKPLMLQTEPGVGYRLRMLQ
jgi:two-component system KDP operon response regulator KdpE